MSWGRHARVKDRGQGGTEEIPQMRKNRPLTAFAFAFVVLVAAHVYAEPNHETTDIDRVLLISIDGMHVLDYQNCVKDGYCPTLTTLGKTGVNYTRTASAKPSDSFPGLMALVTGGTPRTVGAFYDVAYDRVLAPPQTTTGNGVAGGACTEGGA